MCTCELKKTTAEALISMYSLDDQGRHIGPWAIESDTCEDLMDGLIIKIKEIRPAKTAMIALLKMGLPERTQGWFKKVRARHAPLRRAAEENSHLPRPRRQAGHEGRYVGRLMPCDAPRRYGWYALLQ